MRGFETDTQIISIIREVAYNQFSSLSKELRRDLIEEVRSKQITRRDQIKLAIRRVRSRERKAEARAEMVRLQRDSIKNTEGKMIKEKIRTRIADIKSELTDQELAACKLIWNHNRTTQSDLARHLCEQKGFDLKSMSSWERVARQVVHNLRSDRGVLILSDNDGYFFPETGEECIDNLKREIGVRLKSFVLRRRMMKTALGQMSDVQFNLDLNAMYQEIEQELGGDENDK